MRLFRGLFLMLWLVGHVSPSFAQDVLTSQDEARTFFNQVIQNSQNPLIVQMAQESLQKLHSASVRHASPKVEVPLLSQVSGSLAVPVLANQATMATFVVDTGATYTVITPRMARKLGIVITPDMPRLTLLTANGLIRAPKVIIPKLSIGGLEVENVEALVQPLGPDPLLAGLLGINFFKGMELTVKADRLILTPTTS